MPPTCGRTPFNQCDANDTVKWKRNASGIFRSLSVNRGASLNPDSVQGGFAKMGAGHVQLLIARVLSSIIGSQGGSVDSFSQNRRGLKGGRFSASIRSNSCRTHPACPGVNGIIVTAARCQSLLAQAPLISPVVSCAPDRRRT
jgi:hypothetical protein